MDKKINKDNESKENYVFGKNCLLFDKIMKMKKAPEPRVIKPILKKPAIEKIPEECSDMDDEESQKMLAQKYKDFEFIPKKVQFLSKEVIKRIITELKKVKRHEHPLHYIHGHVDLVIDLENGTYRRFCK
jgi:hypothetical protein